MEVDFALKDQSSKEGELALKSLWIQIGMSVSVSILALLWVTWLRPKHTLVYPAPVNVYPSLAPVPTSSAFLAKVHRCWTKTKHVLTASDDFLMETIGFDAVQFLQFLRILQRLTFAMTVFGLGVIVPVNIVGTMRTGIWPRMPFDVSFLSISGVNYLPTEKQHEYDTRWYWATVAAVWLFTGIVAWFLHRGSLAYIAMRRRFWEAPAYHLSSRSLFITNLPPNIISDGDLRAWLEASGAIQYPMQQVFLGKENAKLIRLFEKYRRVAFRLQDTVAAYLKGGRKAQKKRPKIRRQGFMGFGGKKVDAINFYTKLICKLYTKIETAVEKCHEPVNYGWISFAHVDWAHASGRALRKALADQSSQATVQISPPAKDIIWPNLILDKKSRRLKRWFGTGIFIIVVCAWLIPVVIFNALASIVDLIRMIPEAYIYISKYWFIIGLCQAYIIPLVLTLLLYLLPLLFKAIARRQGFRTRSSRDQRILAMLYVFFIFNHLVLFSLSSSLLGLYGQLRELVLEGIFDDSFLFNYMDHLVNNYTESSNFWINVVCVKVFGITVELAQAIHLMTIAIRKRFFRPSPRKLKAWANLRYFDYPKHYNILLFFFTITLVHAATSPIILPFALLYFSGAIALYRYLLMTVCVTKTETGGKMWPTVFQMTMVSTLIFQLSTFTVLLLKRGSVQAFVVLPLPVITIAYQVLYGRHIAHQGRFLSKTNSSPSHDSDIPSDVTGLPRIRNNLSQQYRDPALDYAQVVPIVLDDVKDLLAQVYPKWRKDAAVGAQDSRDESSASEHEAPRYELLPTNPNHDPSRFVLYDPNTGESIHFCAVSEDYFATELELEPVEFTGCEKHAAEIYPKDLQFPGDIEPSAPPYQLTPDDDSILIQDHVCSSIVPSSTLPPMMYQPSPSSVAHVIPASTPTGITSTVQESSTTTNVVPATAPVGPTSPEPTRPSLSGLQQHRSLPLLPQQRTKHSWS